MFVLPILERDMDINAKNTLLQQLKEGSYYAFDKLYEEYFDLLYGFVFSLTRSRQTTAEVVQDTFIKVWLNKHKIDTDQSFKAWLYRIARNSLLDEVKKQFHSPLFDDYLIHTSNEKLAINEEEEMVDFDAFRQALHKVKEELSPRQAEVFELCKEQGLAAAEVAQQLNISEQAVFNHLSLAMKTIRQKMAHFSFLFSIFF